MQQQTEVTPTTTETYCIGDKYRSLITGTVIILVPRYSDEFSPVYKSCGGLSRIAFRQEGTTGYTGFQTLTLAEFKRTFERAE